MDSRLWLTLAGLVFCASTVFAYPLTEESTTNSTAKNETKDSERAVGGAPPPPTNGMTAELKAQLSKSEDHEITMTYTHDREKPNFLGGCKGDESLSGDDKAKEPMGSCECEAYRSILEKFMLRVLPEMEASAIDPGIMLSCTLTKELAVQIRLAVRFKSKACVNNCHKICGSDGSECKVTKEHPLLGFAAKFEAVRTTKQVKWELKEISKLDAGEFMNAIGGCNVCQQEPSSCPAACGCPQTYTAQECPANTPPQCCQSREAPAAPAQGEVQMQQIVVAPAPQQITSQATQPVPAAEPCRGGSCMMGIPVVQASICASHCPSTCAPSCLPGCCNGGGEKRMLAGR